MKRIKIWADIHSTGLFDDVGRYYERDETTVSAATWEELSTWVDSYDFIAVMDIRERNFHLAEIKELDNKGIELLKKIRQEWKVDSGTGENLFFVYFSEGLLKEIPVN